MQKKCSKFVIIIGAAKSGTTTLANWLGSRSDMFLPSVKEPRFFTEFSEIDWKGPNGKAFSDTLVRLECEYENLYRNEKGAEWGIDASTDYLWCQESSELIAKFAKNCEVKIIAVLRDPIERAISEYCHTVRDGMETESLGTSIRLERERIANHWHPLFYHVRRSQYYDDMKRYIETFGKSMIVLKSQELRDQKNCLKKINNFLRILPEDLKYDKDLNKSYVYKNELYRWLMTNPKINKLGRFFVRPSLRKYLRGIMEKAGTKNRPGFDPQDIELLKTKLQSDLNYCRNDPIIQTKF